MAIIAHRIRSVATIAGPERLRAVDQLFRVEPLLVRAFIEAHDPRAIAESLVRLMDAVGVESEAHARRLAAWTRMLGEAAGLSASALAQCEIGALVHDVGKIAVPDAVVHSALTLDPRELDLIQMHASLGHAILFGVPALGDAATFVLAHHEYWDGSGYPNQLRGAAIPRAARLFTIVDSYDAMIRVDRAFRVGVSGDVAGDEIIALSGRKYDPELVAVFRRVDRQRWLDVWLTHPDRGST